MANTKHEDAILKMGFDYFRDTILKILGIHHDFVESGITELVELTIHSLYMDFTFLTKDDFYIHIEFQTTDSGKKDRGSAVCSHWEDCMRTEVSNTFFRQRNV